MQPKYGPLWSSTITSWIMVSSRWVFGSSKGMRQFSAKSTTKSPVKSRRSEAPVAPQIAGVTWCSIGVRLMVPESLVRVIRAKNRVGSARQEKVTSRAAPIPSKAEPVSRAATVVKKRPRAKR